MHYPTPNDRVLVTLTLTPFAPTTDVQDNLFQLTFSESLTPNHAKSIGLTPYYLPYTAKFT